MTCSPVPAPGVAISRGPDSGTTLRHGDPLTFTCNITLDPAVDSEVAVTASWTGPGGPITAGVSDVTGSGPYQSTLTLSSLTTSNSGDYTCTASVGPGDLMFINESEGSDTLVGITVGKNYLPLIVHVYII